MTTETFKLDCEYTDTFGDEANYSWVRRATIELPCGVSNRELVRKAKAALNITGLKCNTRNYGDMWTLKPYGMCTVAHLTVQY